jgi:flagellar assembly factor FliW
MKIQTLKFGEVEINDDLIFDFIEPILGYEELSKYTLLDIESDSPFKWLQSTTNPEVSFAVSIPAFFNINYEFSIPEETTKKIDLYDTEQRFADFEHCKHTEKQSGSGNNQSLGLWSSTSQTKKRFNLC